MEELGVARRALEALTRRMNRDPRKFALAEYIDSRLKALVALNGAKVKHLEPFVSLRV